MIRLGWNNAKINIQKRRMTERSIHLERKFFKDLNGDIYMLILFYSHY